MAEYIIGVRTVSGAGTSTFTKATPPAGGSGPAVTVRYLGETIVGGTSQAIVTTPTPVSRIVVSIDGVVGYYDLTLPTAATSVTLLVTFAQDPPESSFTTQFAGASSGGSVGTYSPVSTSMKSVGTGDVQVSVSWDALSDVDLHVVEPSGAEIFYANDTSPSGGRLDLDSNAGCAIDRVNNENVTWEGRSPPRGIYTVRLDYFSSCNVTSTQYVVTVNIRGRPTQVFTGTFSGRGDTGGVGSGIPITTFTY